MWRHAEVYNAVITHQTRRLDMHPAEVSWHLIWLWHEGMIGFDVYGNPVASRDASTLKAA